MKADVLGKVLLSSGADTAPRVRLDTVGDTPKWTIVADGGEAQDDD